MITTTETYLCGSVPVQKPSLEALAVGAYAASAASNRQRAVSKGPGGGIPEGVMIRPTRRANRPPQVKRWDKKPSSSDAGQTVTGTGSRRCMMGSSGNNGKLY